MRLFQAANAAGNEFWDRGFTEAQFCLIAWACEHCPVADAGTDAKHHLNCTTASQPAPTDSN